ncbi:sulfotransferase domain-containing protein [Thiorhodococcus mannitoliphagus]|uniref:Sulfotransferase domain-containing protein n=2 Tax=Thiorhodococcus mannitoliphagus TaxID=329406 RepID=A0A6P1E6V9_9GAMM|nr:sulfotransferase domain-containing protein [Thiorhodococcus mannitoliphagus]NEX23285.1 sulfotransferase domain-containing protein [Thiorhodococcus mannitoliphagus]
MKSGAGPDRPDFLIIGSAKSGTTSLYDDLSRIPGLYLPSEKEPSVLTRYNNLAGMRREYRLIYRDAVPGQLCGDGSTNYTKLPLYPGVDKSAYALCEGHLKLIMIMRDPIERICSQLRHDIAMKRLMADEADSFVLSNPLYISLSDYAMQLLPWVETFGKDALLCISYHDYIGDRFRAVTEVSRFLGVSMKGVELDRGVVRNRSIDLRYTSKGVSRMLDMSLYRHFLRRLISSKLRARFREIILPKANVPPIRLSEATKLELRKRLPHVEDEVAALVGRRIRLHGPK